MQLKRELKLQTPAMPKKPRKKSTAIAVKAKKVSISILKTPVKSSKTAKKKGKEVIIIDKDVEEEEVVVTNRGSKRPIILPQHFRSSH